MCTKNHNVRIEEMKEAILKYLRDKYGTAPMDVAPCGSSDIETNHFMLEGHANAAREVCKKNNYLISFREAGKYTLDRIRIGNPCKGHEISDKSIKPKGESYTYSINANRFEMYSGLIGVPHDRRADVPNLIGLWREKDNKPQKVSLTDIGSDDLRNYYTGDYDMHDLFRWDGDKYVRILADTPDESSAIDYFNRIMTSSDYNNGEFDFRKKIIDKYRKSYPSERLRNCEYSLIRHGAQTSFMSYLLSITGCKELKEEIEKHGDHCFKIPWEDEVMNISEKICVFDKNGESYILDGSKQIYSFYSTRNMLNQIPFYCFFKKIRKIETDSKRLDDYADSIFYYLKNCYSK